MFSSRSGAGMRTAALTRRHAAAAVTRGKRGREEDDEVVQVRPVLCADGAAMKPSEATPCRRRSTSTEAQSPMVMLAGDASFCCATRFADDEDARSQSARTAATDGLSEDSIFFLDLHGTNSRDRAPSVTSSAEVAVASRAAANECEAAAWQQQLSDFFARLDERPLRVAPRE